ncbi:MAG: hypothetical protein VCC01_04395 [Candidatus Hydrogenedentota bacterium]
MCFVLVGVFFLRESGTLDWNLYKSEVTSESSTSKSGSLRGPANEGPDSKHFSYRYSLEHEGAIIHQYSYDYGGMEPLIIEAVLDEPEYSGNYKWPFTKNFTMTYRCVFTTTEAAGEREVSGEMDGEVNVKIRGICSRLKSKKIAFDEATKYINNYLEKNILG